MESTESHALLKPVGRVKDAHSLKGELYVRLFAESADWLDGFTTAYLVSPDANELLELEVERAKPHREGIILKLKGLEDRTPAEELRGYELEIPAELLVSAPGEDIYLNELLGFTVVDLNGDLRAVIEGFGSNTVQDLLIIKVAGREHMIPFVKPFIEKIDFEARTISMRLPEGLIEK